MDPIQEVEPTPATRRQLLLTATCCTVLIVASNLANVPMLLRQSRATDRLTATLQQFSIDSKSWREHHHQLLEDLDKYARQEFRRPHDDLELLKARGN